MKKNYFDKLYAAAVLTFLAVVLIVAIGLMEDVDGYAFTSLQDLSIVVLSIVCIVCAAAGFHKNRGYKKVIIILIMVIGLYLGAIALLHLLLSDTPFLG